MLFENLRKYFLRKIVSDTHQYNEEDIIFVGRNPDKTYSLPLPYKRARPIGERGDLEHKLSRDEQESLVRREISVLNLGANAAVIDYEIDREGNVIRAQYQPLILK